MRQASRQGGLTPLERLFAGEFQLRLALLLGATMLAIVLVTVLL